MFLFNSSIGVFSFTSASGDATRHYTVHLHYLYFIRLPSPSPD